MADFEIRLIHDDIDNISCALANECDRLIEEECGAGLDVMARTLKDIEYILSCFTQNQCLVFKIEGKALKEVSCVIEE